MVDKIELERKLLIAKEATKSCQDAIAVLYDLAGEHIKNIRKMQSEVDDLFVRCQDVEKGIAERVEMQNVMDIAKSANKSGFQEARAVLLDEIHQGMANKTDDGTGALVKAIVAGDVRPREASEVVKQLLRTKKGKDYIA